jgi:asparagine synthase (glutamine-hydrolysing)
MVGHSASSRRYLDLKTHLPDDILTKVDRASMAVSLEVRPPLLDHLLIERLFSIPTHFRTPNGQKKYLLKEAVKDLLPEPILSRPKKGFSAPWTAWMQTEQAWAERMLNCGNDRLHLLRKDIAATSPLFSRGAKLWTLLLLQQWLLRELV